MVTKKEDKTVLRTGAQQWNILDSNSDTGKKETEKQKELTKQMEEK